MTERDGMAPGADAGACADGAEHAPMTGAGCGCGGGACSGESPAAAGETDAYAGATAEGEPKKRRGFHPGLVLATVAVVLGIIYTFPVLLMRVRAEPNEAAALSVLRTFARRATLTPEEEHALTAFLDQHGDAGFPSAGYRFILHAMPNHPILSPMRRVPEGEERVILLLAEPVVPGVGGHRSFAYVEGGGGMGRLYARPAVREAEGETEGLEWLVAGDGADGWVELPLVE